MSENPNFQSKSSCAMCGDCCESIHLNRTKKELIPLYGVCDPRDDAQWRRWLNVKGYKNADRSNWIMQWLNANFIIDHWHGGVRNGAGKTKHWSCDQFNKETRLCMAHDERPPVCSEYPWYGGQPNPEKLSLDNRCSFWHDIPKDKWPSDVTPLPVPVKIRT